MLPANVPALDSFCDEGGVLTSLATDKCDDAAEVNDTLGSAMLDNVPGADSPKPVDVSGEVPFAVLSERVSELSSSYMTAKLSVFSIMAPPDVDFAVSKTEDDRVSRLVDDLDWCDLCRCSR